MRILHTVVALCLLAACRSGRTLVDANRAALEQVADLENDRTDAADGVLAFAPSVSDLGEVPLGARREATVEVTNRSDRPLVLLGASTSCSCTEVVWSRRPIPAGATASLRVRFSAELPGTFFKKIAIRHNAATAPCSFAVRGVVVTADER